MRWVGAWAADPAVAVAVAAKHGPVRASHMRTRCTAGMASTGEFRLMLRTV